VSRFERAWLAALQDVWVERRRGAPLVLLAMLLRGAAAILAVALMTRAALRGGVSSDISSRSRKPSVEPQCSPTRWASRK